MQGGPALSALVYYAMKPSINASIYSKCPFLSVPKIKTLKCCGYGPIGIQIVVMDSNSNYGLRSMFKSRLDHWFVHKGLIKISYFCLFVSLRRIRT